MATKKTAEWIRKFAADIGKLEELIGTEILGKHCRAGSLVVLGLNFKKAKAESDAEQSNLL